MSKKRKRSAVSAKISTLRHEGVKQDQAVAESLNMSREGRLTKSGGYIRSKRKNRRKGGRY